MGTFFKKIFCIHLLFLLFGSCTSMLYWPDHYLHGDPETLGIKLDKFFISSPDGTKLLVWGLKQKNQNKKVENLVLMLHGNAENMSSHIFNLTWMLEHNTDLLTFDYRGYGLSKGSPSLKGIHEDTLAFLKLAHEKFQKGNYKRLIIYAQSLGGQIVLRALEEIDWRSEISLLVLDSTYRSNQEIAYQKTFKLLGWLVSDDFTANFNLGHLTMPLLVLHSPFDRVVPYQFGEKLFNQAPSEKKVFWKIEKGNHSDAFFVEKGIYREKFLNLINSL